MLNIKIEQYRLHETINAENWDEFASVWPLAPRTAPDFSTSSWPYGIDVGPARVDDSEIAALIGLGVKVELVPLPGAMLVKMQDRAKWESRIEPEHLMTGQAVQIAIADVGLLRINTVKVVEDICTDALQEELDDGWRILAVCPPNAARRPDYILGRTK